jgi:hypothetical protein
VAGKVLRRLRETTFIVGRPANDTERVLAAVSGLPGLDQPRLARDMASAGVLDAVRRDWAETRRPCAEVLAIDEPGPHNGRAKEIGDRIRYALPTLRFTWPAGDQVVPSWRPLSAYVDAVLRVCLGNAADRSPFLRGPSHRVVRQHDGAGTGVTDRATERFGRRETRGHPKWSFVD